MDFRPIGHAPSPGHATPSDGFPFLLYFFLLWFAFGFFLFCVSSGFRRRNPEWEGGARVLRRICIDFFKSIFYLLEPELDKLVDSY